MCKGEATMPREKKEQKIGTVASTYAKKKNREMENSRNHELHIENTQRRRQRERKEEEGRWKREEEKHAREGEEEKKEIQFKPKLILVSN